jgi:hypothetical protein
VQKGRAGDAIIMRWMMTMMTMARGGSKGKSINDSISEHKCIITSNIIYSITVIIPINNNCMVALCFCRGCLCHHFEFNYILNLYVLSMCFVRYRSWIICTVYNAVPMLFF